MGFFGTIFSAIPVWLIVVLVLLVVVVILLRTTNQVYVLYLLKDNFFMIFLVAIFIVFAISLTHIHTTYDVDFTAEGISKIIQIYLDWLVGFAKNVGRVTSYAVQQDWVYNATSGS